MAGEGRGMPTWGLPYFENGVHVRVMLPCWLSLRDRPGSLNAMFVFLFSEALPAAPPEWIFMITIGRRQENARDSEDRPP
jgi:hypothetical protein